MSVLEYAYEMSEEMRELFERMDEEADPETGEIPEEIWAEWEDLLAKRDEKLSDIRGTQRLRRADSLEEGHGRASQGSSRSPLPR
jgi:hypothetical protein